MTDECKQKEAFMTELFETVPNSLYYELKKKKIYVLNTNRHLTLLP